MVSIANLIGFEASSSSPSPHHRSSSLAAAGNCPPGVYVQQDEQSPLTLHGVLFPPSSGPYAGGVFRFTIQWTGSVITTIKTTGRGDVKEKTTVKRTSTTPIVTFQQGLSHPLIHVSSMLSLSNRPDGYELNIPVLPSCPEPKTNPLPNPSFSHLLETSSTHPLFPPLLHSILLHLETARRSKSKRRLVD